MADFAAPAPAPASFPDMTRPAGAARSEARLSTKGIGKSFGQVVRGLREERGWSQEQFAARAELNRSYMGEIERAGAMPSLATAAKLALALEVPLWRLIRRCEEGAGR
jgi:ribosome-binding protein aMBF1 (putative translation factor)